MYNLKFLPPNTHARKHTRVRTHTHTRTPHPPHTYTHPPTNTHTPPPTHIHAHTHTHTHPTPHTHTTPSHTYLICDCSSLLYLPVEAQTQVPSVATSVAEIQKPRAENQNQQKFNHSRIM